MNEYELLSNHSIVFAESTIAKTADDAVRLAEGIGYPIAMKISTRQPVHKTDLGLVKLGVRDDEVKSTFSEIVQTAIRNNIEYDGVWIQQMAKPDLELIVGIKRDKSFGPTILLGIGGIYAEIFRDFSIRLAPITDAEAREMISDLRSSEIFTARGKRYNVDALVDLLLKVSKIATTEKIRELDLNPVFLYPETSPQGYMVVDVRAVW